jgi:hypothetical protein
MVPADALGRLSSGDARFVVRNVTMGRVLTDRPWGARNREEASALALANYLKIVKARAIIRVYGHDL